VLEQFQENWPRQIQPEAIENACRNAGHAWRVRKLDPVTTIHLFLLQILHGNAAITELPRLAKIAFSATAYCKARARLPREVFEALLEGLHGAMQGVADAESRWRGHRVFLMDGSGFSMPDTPELRAYFGQPSGQKEGCGFPAAHTLSLFHYGTGLLLRMLGSPLFRHDLSGAAELHPELQEDDVLLADRGFCSYAHLALLQARKAQAVLRLHQRQIVDFTPGRAHATRAQGAKGAKGLPRSRWLKRLGKEDQWVEWQKPEECPEWMSQEQYDALPETLVVRELRYRISQAGFRTRQVTVVTTLRDAKRYPKGALAELYLGRWEVESNLDDLKTTLKMDVLRCETVEGVRKEMTMFALVYNLLRLVMLEASKRQGVSPRRISFIDAMRWLKHAAPGESLPELIVNPDRFGRVEARVKKRRPKTYRLMTKTREEMRKSIEYIELVA